MEVMILKHQALWLRDLVSRINAMDEITVCSHLRDAIHSLNIVATGMDGDEELTLESMKAGARGLLVSLGYNINE